MKKGDLAVVSTGLEELRGNVSKALNGAVDTACYVNRSIAYLKKERDIKVIQEGMRQRMASLVEEAAKK